MTQKTRKFDLPERTHQFALRARNFVRNLPKTSINLEDSKQLIRSSGSVGANYIEANESLGKKDFLMRIRICRKEAKECGYWLRLLGELNDNKIKEEARSLSKESLELAKIFHAILENSKSKI